MDLACLHQGIRHHSLFCSQTYHCLTALCTVVEVMSKTGSGYVDKDVLMFVLQVHQLFHCLVYHDAQVPEPYARCWRASSSGAAAAASVLHILHTLAVSTAQQLPTESLLLTELISEGRPTILYDIRHVFSFLLLFLLCTLCTNS